MHVLYALVHVSTGWGEVHPIPLHDADVVQVCVVNPAQGCGESTVTEGGGSGAMSQPAWARAVQQKQACS